MAKIIQDIRSKGMISAYIDAPFDKGKIILETLGYEIVSLEENARLRLQTGKTSDASKYGTWTKEGVVYIPGTGAILTKNSPIMRHVKEARNCHKNQKEYYLTVTQLEEALSDCVLLSKVPENIKIPTNRFGDNEITVYAFGDVAKQYGEFLRDAGIKTMPVKLTDVENKAFARQIWFGCLCVKSVIAGDDWALDYSGRMRGIYESSKRTTKF